MFVSHIKMDSLIDRCPYCNVCAWENIFVIMQQVVVCVVFIENDLLLLGAWIYLIEPY